MFCQANTLFQLIYSIDSPSKRIIMWHSIFTPDTFWSFEYFLCAHSCLLKFIHSSIYNSFNVSVKISQTLSVWSSESPCCNKSLHIFAPFSHFGDYFFVLSLSLHLFLCLLKIELVSSDYCPFLVQMWIHTYIKLLCLKHFIINSHFNISWLERISCWVILAISLSHLHLPGWYPNSKQI